MPDYAFDRCDDHHKMVDCDSGALRRGVAPAVPNSKSPAGSHSDTFASRSLALSISKLRFAFSSATMLPHIPNKRLAALIDMHMLDPHNLRATVP